MRRTRLTCRRCPKYGRNQVCAHLAQYMIATHPVCDYGRRLIKNEKSVACMRRKRGNKKRVVTTPGPADYDRLNNLPEPRRRTRKIRGVKVLAK